MYTQIWKDLWSPTLFPSTITLWAYDVQPSQSQGVYQNITIFFAGRKTLMDVEFFDAQVDYTILLGRSFMYSMKDLASSLLRVMMFPKNRKVITID